jgi:RND family efflux transporter MFP subunit
VTVIAGGNERRPPRRPRRARRAILATAALLLVGAGAAGAWRVLGHRASEPPPDPATFPAVRVLRASAQSVQLRIAAQGTVMPNEEVALRHTVGGSVVWMSPALLEGGLFAAGEELLRVDPNELARAVREAEADVARARTVVARAEATQEAVSRRLEPISSGAPVPAPDAEPARLQQARERLAAAEARLAAARRSAENATLRAPFGGCTLRRSMEVGRRISPLTTIATISSTDHADVRLTLPDEDLRFLELPRDGEASGGATGPEALLHAHVAGRDSTWIGRVLRAEGTIDTRTRTVTVIARVEDPYDRKGQRGMPALVPRAMVTAEIAGRTFADVIALPRSAVRLGDQVLVVQLDRPGAAAGPGRIAVRRVEVLRREPGRTLVSEGVRDGELVCVAPLDALTDGTRVRAVPPPAAKETRGAEPAKEARGAEAAK